MNDPKQQRVLTFRCAEKGTCFDVVFSRYSSAHRFQILSIPPRTVVPGPPATGGSIARYPVIDGTAGGRPQSAVDQAQEGFAADDFDFSGWHCPCCGHARGELMPEFVRCSKCGEYVCGARIREIPGGGLIFACHDGCGGSGRVEGTLTSYAGSSTVGHEQDASASSRQRGLLPRSRD
jgi:hypothetical protein